MTDWIDIHEDFTDELQARWEKNGFQFWQVQEWIDAGLEPEDVDFALYIEKQGYTVDDVERKEGRLDKLRDKYAGNKEEKEDISDSSSNEDEEVETVEIKTRRMVSLPERVWTNINSNFTPELVREWKLCGFTYEECADWINIVAANQQDLAIYNSAYYAWLRDVKRVGSEWVLNHGDVEKLQHEYHEYSLMNQQIYPTYFD